MPVTIFRETVCKLVCDRCDQEDEVRADGVVSKSAMCGEAVESLGWRVKGHRGEKPDEAVCSDCVRNEAIAKQEKHKALARIAEERRSANVMYSDERKKLLNRSQPKGDNGIAEPEVEPDETDGSADIDLSESALGPPADYLA